MDSDFSHPPDMIQGRPIKRKLISKAATEIAKKGLGVEANDPMSGFFAFKKANKS